MIARGLIATTIAAVLATAGATFAAGASAAYLSEDLYGTARLPAAAHRSDQGVPQSLAAPKTVEGAARNVR